MVNLSIANINDDELLEMEMYEKGQIIMACRRNDKEIHSSEKPYVVISNIHLNVEENGILAVPISREETKVRPLYHVKIKVNSTEGYVICENIIKVPKICIQRTIGKISENELKKIDSALAAVYENHDTNKFLKAYEDAAKKMKKLCEIENRKKDKELRETVDDRVREISEKLNSEKEKVSELAKENNEQKKEIEKLNQTVENVNTQNKSCTERIKQYEGTIKDYENKFVSYEHDINKKDNNNEELKKKIQLLETVGKNINDDANDKITELETENSKLKACLKKNTEDDLEREVLIKKQKLYEETNKKYENDLFKCQVVIKKLQNSLRKYEPDNKYINLSI